MFIPEVIYYVKFINSLHTHKNLQCFCAFKTGSITKAMINNFDDFFCCIKRHGRLDQNMDLNFGTGSGRNSAVLKY